MNVLVTAGNTRVHIDRVRCLTNVFTGRTGAGIALAAHERGHAVTLLTSHPEAVAGLCPQPDRLGERWKLAEYSTFEDLRGRMACLVAGGGFDALIHCAAVSDYLPAGVYAPAPGTHFEPGTGRWDAAGTTPPGLLDRRAGKVKSDEPELWLRLVRAPKLIDLVRTEWSFRGVLVKFKLEVGLSEAELLGIAERSRNHSAADLMVANTYEETGSWALLGPLEGGYEKVSRRELPGRLLAAIEQLYGRRAGEDPAHG
jgi:phosphopantothenoylcysteine synthetase/decarboxylase